LFRIAVPAVFGAVMLAGVAAYLQAQILPITNQTVAEANDRIKGRTSQRIVRGPDKQWLFGKGKYLYNFLRFDPSTERIERLQVFEFDEQRRLTARLLADVAQYTPEGWVLEGGWARTFRDREQLRFEPLKRPVRVDLPEGPAYFRAEEPRPTQMTYGQLLAYVNELRQSGQHKPELEVALQNKLAYPFGIVVMAFVALPFAFRLERRGALYGLGISIVVGMVFMAVYALFKTLGDVGVFPAAVAVWSPAVLFMLLASYLFLGVRS
ncbi:MAG: LptF/LptG family permease, partial [Holophagales bacterium]|nr:LptF/LptG family permease [Holophagales bacterium]